MKNQLQLVFFGPDHVNKRPEPTDEEKRIRVDRRSKRSPFSRFVGNEKAVRKMTAAAYTALGRDNHEMNELAFAIFGPSSSGKTSLARCYAETVSLPFMEISPKSLRTTDDLFRIIKNVLLEHDIPLVEEDRPKHYTLPPCIIFIDEVHALMPSIVDGLLKATEFNDAQLVTESGVVIDTSRVTWMIATTDEGKLFEAFRTRFSPVVLNYLNKSDVAKIVKLVNDDLSMGVCELVAKYNSRIPRKALEFARYMRMVQAMQPKDSWEAIARQVASDEGIDEFGMHEVHLKILMALGQGPIAKNRIALIAGRKDEEVERNILPWLMISTDDQPALVGVSHRGYVLTAAGAMELDRRRIAHQGLTEMGVK